MNIPKGSRRGLLVFLRDAEPHLKGELVILCRCDCGEIARIRRNMFISGHARSCGCVKEAEEVVKKERKKRSPVNVIYSVKSIEQKGDMVECVLDGNFPLKWSMRLPMEEAKKKIKQKLEEINVSGNDLLKKWGGSIDSMGNG